MNNKIEEIKDLYPLFKENYGFEIIKIFHKELGFELYEHNKQGSMIDPKLKKDLWLSVLFYFTGSILEEDFTFEESEHVYYELQNIENDINNKTINFSCFCTQNNCKKIHLIVHKSTGKRFLTGIDCFKDRFNRLYSELKEHKKNLRLLRKKKLKEQQLQNLEQQRQLQQRITVSETIVKFGKYKGKTYNDWDEKYTEYMLCKTECFEDPRYQNNNNKIKDYLCNKFNIVI